MRINTETSDRQNPVVKALEAVVTAVIVLVIAQTFLEDYAVLVGWAQDIRKILLITGFGFDLFFTIEFISRLYFSLAEGRTGRYLFRERGWIDFLASVPLLMFSSGPPVLAIVLGAGAAVTAGGMLNMLKLVKAIRIARILRLLRILKIFRNIKYAESPMAQRHIARVITIATTVFVFSLLAFSLLGQWVPSLRSGEEYGAPNWEIVDRIQESGASESSLRAVHDVARSVLIVKRGGRTVYSRHDAAFYRSNFAAGDFEVLRRDDLEVTVDLRGVEAAIEKAQSRQNLLFFSIVVISVLAYLLLYSGHFALTVSDPIHVMRRGLSEPSYNLEVKIPDAFADDDIFQLARLYNEEYLPLKDRGRQESESAGSDLRMEDLGDILES